MGNILKLIRDKKSLIIVALMMTIHIVCNLALPTIMSMIIDNGINEGDINYIISFSVVMIFVSVLGFISYLVYAKKISKINSEVSYDLRKLNFEKAMTISYTDFSKIGASKLLSRTTSDVWHLSEGLNAIVTGVIMVPVYIIGGTILSLLKDVYLSLIFFAFTPILLIVVYSITKKVNPMWEVSDSYIDKQNNIIRERFRGIRVIRAFNKEDKEQKRVDIATNTMARYIIKANTKLGLVSPLSMLLLNITTILILVVGSVRLQDPTSTLTAGSIVAIIQYVSLIMTGFVNMSWAMVQIPRIKISMKRIDELQCIPSLEKGNDLDKQPFEGGIEIKDLSFSYHDSENYAIENITLSIPKGSKVAFIGGTGSGKSTVISAIQGLYDISRGHIFYDGVDYNDISKERIGKNLSIALQRNTMFNASIRENVRMFNSEISDESIMDVLEISQISDFVKDQKEGLDFEIKSSGSNISGGQKQRISIARTIIQNKPIYIFDDSFSALDFLTEAKLKSALNNKLDGKTRIIVTQRVSSAINCDIIYVFDGGKIVGAGKHKDLLDNCTIYKEIYNSQVGGAL